MPRNIKTTPYLSKCARNIRMTWAKKTILTRMWANVQRHGCPAEYRWHPLFNAAKLADARYLPCSNAAKTRKPLKLAGVPQTTGSISATSRLKFTIL